MKDHTGFNFQSSQSQASSSGELPRPVNSITIEVTKSFRVRVVVTYEEDFDTLVLSDNGTQF